MPQAAAGQLIAEGQHDEGGMVRQHPQGLPQLGLIIGVAFLGLKGGLGVPVAQLRLHEHAHLVCGGERGFRGRMAVEAHAVHPVAAVEGKDLPPPLHLHGRMPLLGEHGAVGLAAQEDPPAVEGQEAVFRPEVPHAEAHRAIFLAHGDGQGIEAALLLVPAADVPTQGQAPEPHVLRAGVDIGGSRDGAFQRIAGDGQGGFALVPGVDLHAHVHGIAMGIDPRPRQEVRLLHPQAHVAQQAVPVGLGFVGGGGGEDDGVMGPAGVAVVRNEGDFIVAGHEPGNLEHIGGADAALHGRGNILSVQAQGQVTAALHLQEEPLALGNLPVQAAGDFRRALAGDDPGQPGADAVLRLVDGAAGVGVGVPLLAAHVPVADAALIQRAGDGDGLGHVRNGALPDSAQVDGMHHDVSCSYDGGEGMGRRGWRD